MGTNRRGGAWPSLGDNAGDLMAHGDITTAPKAAESGGAQRIRFALDEQLAGPGGRYRLFFKFNDAIPAEFGIVCNRWAHSEAFLVMDEPI